MHNATCLHDNATGMHDNATGMHDNATGMHDNATGMHDNASREQAPAQRPNFREKGVRIRTLISAFQGTAEPAELRDLN